MSPATVVVVVKAVVDVSACCWSDGFKMDLELAAGPRVLASIG